MECPICQSHKLVKKGKIRRNHGQNLKCKDCNFTFSDRTKSHFLRVWEAQESFKLNKVKG